MNSLSLAEFQDWYLDDGSWIEVIGAEKDFLGSFFPGEIVERYWKTHYVVQYDFLFEEEDSNEPLKEILPGCQLRPSPPVGEFDDYEIGDEVDAWHEGGYWSGEITKVMGNGRNKRFEVLFPLTGDRKRYPYYHLRPHLEYNIRDERWYGQEKYAFLWDV